MMYYPIVDYKDNNEKIKNILKKDLNITYDSLEEDIQDIIDNRALCINNIRKCIKIEYDSNTKNINVQNV